MKAAAEAADGAAAPPDDDVIPIAPGAAAKGSLPGGPPTAFSYRKLLTWSWAVVQGAFGGFILSLVLSMLTIVLSQYSVQLVSEIIAGLKGAGRIDAAVLWTTAFFVILAIALLPLELASRASAIWADTSMLRSLQQRLHDQLLQQPAAYHDRHDLGETTTIVMQDAVGAQPMLRDLIAFPLTQGVGLVSALLFLFHNLGQAGGAPVLLQALLGLVLLALPAIGWWLANQLRHAFDLVRVRQSELNNEFINSASAPLEVQLMGAVPQRSRAFAARLANLMRARVAAQFRLEIANQFQTGVPSLLQAGFLAYAVIVAMSSGSAQAAGAIVAIYLFVPLVIEPVQQLVRFATGLQMTWAQVSRVGALLDTIPPPRAEPARALPSPAAGASPQAPVPLRFERVTFTYPGAPAPVLRDLSHIFESGLVTAIVGRSGSGKSSILSLANGLRTAQSGAVRLGDEPIAALDPLTLRTRVAMVSQFPLFVADTVRTNFQLAKADATDEEIEGVARRTGLWPILEKVGGSRPLDVEVPRQAGKGFSGGERRLIAITRVLLRRPWLLLLDEPTTGVDAVSAEILSTSLKESSAGITTILVEHNLDFVRRFADRVCCLEDGRFTDVGTPSELAARPTLFQRLLEAQERFGETHTMDIQNVPLPLLTAGKAEPPYQGSPR